MRSLLFGTFLTLTVLGSSSFSATAPMPADQASRQIEMAVDAFETIALSGVSKYKVDTVQTVKAALYSLAIKEGYISSADEFNWTSESDGWEVDAGNWTETTMKGAFRYLGEENEDFVESLESDEELSKLATYRANLKAARTAFKLLLHTGVMFGIVPFGAVQCGVTFPALAIIDPHSKTVYVVIKEGSGC